MLGAEYRLFALCGFRAKNKILQHPHQKISPSATKDHTPSIIAASLPSGADREIRGRRNPYRRSCPTESMPSAPSSVRANLLLHVSTALISPWGQVVVEKRDLKKSIEHRAPSRPVLAYLHAWEQDGTNFCSISRLRAYSSVSAKLVQQGNCLAAGPARRFAPSPPPRLKAKLTFFIRLKRYNGFPRQDLVRAEYWK